MVFNLTALEALAPNLWIFIAHVIAFAIVVIILIIFTWKPTKKFLEERKKMINADLDDANKKNQDANLLLEQAQQKVLDSKTQATKLQELAEEQAHMHWEKVIKKAKNEANQVKEKAQNDIDKMEVEFEQAKKAEIAKVALIAAEELMRKNIDSKTNQKLIDDVLSELAENE